MPRQEFHVARADTFLRELERVDRELLALELRRQDVRDRLGSQLAEAAGIAVDPELTPLQRKRHLEVLGWVTQRSEKARCN